MAGRRRRAALLALASLAAALAAWFLVLGVRRPDDAFSDAPPSAVAPSAATPSPLADLRPGLAPSPSEGPAPPGEVREARSAAESRPRAAVRSATTFVVDELGQALPGVRLFLDLGGRFPKSRDAGLLDPAEFDSLRRDDPAGLARWTRVADHLGRVPWGAIDGGLSPDLEHAAIVLAAPRRRSGGEGPAAWQRSGSTASLDGSEVDLSWTLRVRRGAGGFVAQLGGVGERPHVRVQPRLENGLFQFGGIEGTSLEVERSTGADATVVGDGYPEGTYRLVVVTQDGRALEALFDVVDGERTVVTRFTDLGATAVNGVLVGSARGTADLIVLRVFDTDAPDRTRFLDAHLRLPVSADGRFRVPVLPGTRRIRLAIPEGGAPAQDWTLSPATFESPFPDPLRVDSSLPARARIRVVDASGKTSRGAVVQVFAKPRSSPSGPGDRILAYACTPLDGDGALGPVRGFPGTWVVQAWPPGGDINSSPPAVEIEATVASGEPQDVVVRLP